MAKPHYDFKDFVAALYPDLTPDIAYDLQNAILGLDSIDFASETVAKGLRRVTWHNGPMLLIPLTSASEIAENIPNVLGYEVGTDLHAEDMLRRAMAKSDE